MSASDFLNGSIANEHLPQTTPPYWDMSAKKKDCPKGKTSQPTKTKSECRKGGPPTSEPECPCEKCDKKKKLTSEPQKKKK